jgi:small subunit ribosomal protein S8
MLTDPIADMATRIRNAILAGHDTVEMPSSKLKAGIAALLKKQGFVTDYSVIDDQLQGILKIYLKYKGPRDNVILGIKRESKPGRRVYVGKDAIPSIRRGLGIVVMSTPQGLMVGEEARKRGVGGEMLLSVW